MHLGIDPTSVWKCIGGMLYHSFTRNSVIWYFIDGRKLYFNRRSRIYHRCSIRLRSGDWDGIWFTLVLCTSNNSVTTYVLWMWAMSSFVGIAMVAKIVACPAIASLSQVPHLNPSTCAAEDIHSKGSIQPVVLKILFKGRLTIKDPPVCWCL